MSSVEENGDDEGVKLGSFILDDPESFDGWSSLDGKTRRVNAFEGMMTSPHIVWVTNASLDTLNMLAASRAKRFLPENFFIIHMKDLFEMFGVPCIAISNTERKDRGLDKYFCKPEDPELASMVLDIVANRIVSLSGMGIVSGYNKYAACIAANSKKRLATYPRMKSNVLVDITKMEVEHITKTFSKYIKGSNFLHLVPPPMTIARLLSETTNQDGSIADVSIPLGPWKSIRLPGGVTPEDIAYGPGNVLVKARIEIPKNISEFILVGSGSKEGLREYFTPYEIQTFLSFGAKIRLQSTAWESERMSVIQKPPMDFLASGSISLGLAWQSRIMSVGFGSGGDSDYQPSYLWLRSMDRNFTFHAALPFLHEISEDVGARNCSLTGYHNGSLWLSIGGGEDAVGVVARRGLMHGWLPKGDLDSYNIDFSRGNLIARVLAGARYSGHEVSLDLDKLGMLDSAARMKMEPSVRALSEKFDGIKLAKGIAKSVSGMVPSPTKDISS